MRIIVLNDQNEVIENWYIGTDECIQSYEVKEILDREFVLAEDENDFRLLMEV